MSWKFFCISGSCFLGFGVDLASESATYLLDTREIHYLCVEGTLDWMLSFSSSFYLVSFIFLVFDIDCWLSNEFTFGI